MAAARLALVTGSTSGIGEAIAYALCGKGYSSALTGFGDEEQIQRIVKECQDRGSPNVKHFTTDLSFPSQIEDLFNSMKCHFGKTPDILINNAGLQHVSPIEDFTIYNWDKVISVNLSACFHTIRLAVKEMKERGWGRIINISSVHSLVASVNKSAYCASKHGMMGLTKVVALETAGTGVTCNSIAPGFALTPLVEPQIEAIAEKEWCSYNQAKKILLQKQPTSEFVLPEEIADMVVYLCGDSSNQITGSNISIDGGWTAQ
jgi:3-hydroxybutyrate dehydrogenase